MMTDLVGTRTKQLGYYLAPEIDAELQRAKHKVITGNQDRVYVVDGREGAGKSSLALQLAYSVDPDFCLNQVCFNADDFEKIARTLPQYRAIVFDEAFNGLSSKGALSKENKKLIGMLMEIRQRNLFIFIVLPSIHLLEKYVAIFRSQALFYVYIDAKNIRRFKRYNYHNKKLLYIFGKPTLSHSRPYNPSTYKFYGKLPPCIKFNEYIEKKLNAFRFKDKPIKANDNLIKQRTILSKMLKEVYGLSYREQAKILNNNKVSIDCTQLARSGRNVVLNEEL